MNYRSVAVWPKGVGINLGNAENSSSDDNGTKERAQAICRRLEREGFGGDRKIFPVSTRVEPILLAGAIAAAKAVVPQYPLESYASRVEEAAIKIQDAMNLDRIEYGLSAAYELLADVHHSWPGRETGRGQGLLIQMNGAIAKLTGRSEQDVADGARCVWYRQAAGKPY